MSDRRSARRRGLAVVAIAGCVLSLAFAVPGLITGAGANVAGPGNVDVSIVASVVTPNLTITGITTSAAASATVAANGVLVIPRSSITFAPLPVTIGAPNATVGDVTVQLVASSDFVGIVNPAGNAEALTGRLEMQVTQAGTMTGCPVGPFAVHATTAGAGTRPYESSTGSATMVDSNFSLPAIAAGAAGCGGLEGSLNSTLSLPITTTTTTTVAGSTSTSTTTTTTTLPTTATTSPVSLLADTPVPSVVLIATITPSPVAANPPTTRPAPPTTIKRVTSTTHAPTTKAPTTSTPKKAAPKKVAPTPARKKKHVAPKVNPHKKRHPKKHHKKHHKPASKPARSALVPTKRKTPSTPTTAHHLARLHRGYFFGVTTTVAHRPRVRRPAGIPINAALVSSRHRASPSPLNLLAILALLVSGWFAVKLVRPDFDDMRRSRSRRRGRLYGIEPRLPD